MKLWEFPFFADENLHPEVVAYLREQGIDVVHVLESAMAGGDDADLLRFAVSQKRVVLTHDRDFGTLSVVQREPLVGIVYLRPGHIQPRFTTESIAALFARDLELTPPFLLVAKRTGQTVSIRLRHL